jgi:hypothetical protein
MGAKIQAFDIFQTPLSSHYPLPLTNYKIVKKSNSETKNFSRLCTIIIDLFGLKIPNADPDPGSGSIFTQTGSATLRYKKGTAIIRNDGMVKKKLAGFPVITARKYRNNTNCSRLQENTSFAKFFMLSFINVNFFPGSQGGSECCDVTHARTPGDSCWRPLGGGCR